MQPSVFSYPKFCAYKIIIIPGSARTGSSRATVPRQESTENDSRGRAAVGANP